VPSSVALRVCTGYMFASPYFFLAFFPGGFLAIAEAAAKIFGT